MTKLTDEASAPASRRRVEFAKVRALWIPRRFFSSSGVDVAGFVADVNYKIQRRGFIHYDGQVITTTLSDAPPPGFLQPDPVEVDGNPFFRPVRFGERSEVIWEGAESYEVPPLRAWDAPQREFFGIDNPYQMAEEVDEYTGTHIYTVVVEPYLFPDERISAIVHGEKDDYYFYCPCHCADVVYTTRHRLICMGCGATHLVLRTGLGFRPKALLTAEDWVELFDEDGARQDDEVELSVVDFQDVEHAESTWTTEQWEEAKHSLIFFARSPQEVVAEAIRGTEADPAIFLEAGWDQVETTPPPAQQLADDSVDVDLFTNAAHALGAGVASFVGARTGPERLVNAIPQLFRAIELLLKAKLRALSPNALDDHPNNPTVLQRLATQGVALAADELNVVRGLRRLRNDLQHGEAKFNHRTGLTLCRKALVFLDRFTNTELDLWLGDAVEPDLWKQLLKIAEVASTAETVVAVRLRDLHTHEPRATVAQCTGCGRDALVRPDPRTGASCLFCKRVPFDAR